MKRIEIEMGHAAVDGKVLEGPTIVVGTYAQPSQYYGWIDAPGGSLFIPTDGSAAQWHPHAGEAHDPSQVTATQS